MSNGPRETVYDDEIAPLMAQIIDITKRAGIPMHASFQLDGDLTCTSHVVTKPAENEHEQRWIAKYNPIAAEIDRRPLSIITRGADGRIKDWTVAL